MSYYRSIYQVSGTYVHTRALIIFPGLELYQAPGNCYAITHVLLQYELKTTSLQHSVTTSVAATSYNWTSFVD